MHFKITLSSFLVFLCINGFSQHLIPQSLVPYQDSLTHLYGYKERKTSIVKIKPQYARAERFSEGVAAVQATSNEKYTQGLWGYIDTLGNILLPFTYRSPYAFNVPGSFENGLTKVSYTPKMYGPYTYLINKKGELFDSDNFLSYNNGLSVIRYTEQPASFASKSRFGFINKKGEVVIPLEYGSASTFSEDLAAVFIDTAWGYVNTKGKVVIPQQFISAGLFKNGKAIVGVIIGTKQRSSSADGDVDWCRHPVLEWAGNHNEYKNEDTQNKFCSSYRLGYINKEGKYIVKPVYNYVSEFENGYAIVGTGDCVDDSPEGPADCHYGIIAESGLEVLKCIYSTISSYTSDGSFFGVSTAKNGDFGVINKHGNVIIPFEYPTLRFGPTIDSLNLITIAGPHGKYGFIDIQNQLVVDYKFDKAGNFTNGVVCVEIHEKKYCMKKDGTLLNYCMEKDTDCSCYNNK